MQKELEDVFKNVPEAISCIKGMATPNEIVDIYSGEFTLINASCQIKVKGEIRFLWFPSIGARFTGEILDCTNPFPTLEASDLDIGGLVLGKALPTFMGGKRIEGVMHSTCVYGDKSIAPSSIAFSVPNLRDFRGDNLKYTSENDIRGGHGRLLFEVDDYVIKLDKRRNFDKYNDSLDSTGGYMMLYCGELTSVKKTLTQSDTRELFHCFSSFLSFLNGRRTFSMFRHGIHEEEIIWSDYTTYNIDTYKHTFSWPPYLTTNEFNKIWVNFYNLWKDPDSRDFIHSVLHWYIEANNQSGYVEGSIIMTQTALELIYNWLIIEKNNLLLGNDADNLSASNKIRLILSELKLDRKIPPKLTNLQGFVDGSPDIEDGCDAFVFLRNALVHSQEQKRKRVSKLDFKIKMEALKLGLWYVELSILYILGYTDVYVNRCDFTKKEELVPWSKKT